MTTDVTYSEEQARFITENADKMRYSELAELFNSKFGTRKTVKQIRKWCQYHGISGISSRDFTPEQEQFIIERQYDMTREQLADKFNACFGTHISATKLKSWCNYRGIHNKNSGRFDDGNVSWQTGLDKDAYWSHFSEESKLSVIQHLKDTNQKYKDGDIVIRHGLPFIYKKTASGEGMDANLISASRVEWEKHHGKLPDTHIVIHMDGDVMNWKIDNLQSIPRKYLPIIRHLGGLTDSIEMNKTKLLYCKLFCELKGQR
jgi:hypothetical protein